MDRKRAIDDDVTHLSRLGLDAYRIHVWERQVSDREGNLVSNEHLDLLDYLLARLSRRGIKVILTPIAWWPAGYPEPDPGTDGFSDGYGKGEMTVSSQARRAQQRYLRQFVTHVNPYAGLTYAEDPNLLALEIFNEPEQPGSPEETTRYVDAMVGALRDAGFRKPVFYNISQGYRDEHGRAVCNADIDGVSHQWYPTGLVRNGSVGGNMLPNVDRYTIPYEGFPACMDKARMVYEFDAADVPGSYLYPAMARSFRGAGFQWATQFAYDPLALAYANTEYQTHYLNLVHTPGKAISFLIAGAVFRQTPRGASYGAYPESERFGRFRVSYEDDLSELVDDTVFLYSNDTGSVPPSPSALRHLAGVGSSPLVAYDGTGAYFVDRLEDGVWRLEVYPDVAWVEDPYLVDFIRRDRNHPSVVLWSLDRGPGAHTCTEPRSAGRSTAFCWPWSRAPARTVECGSGPGPRGWSPPPSTSGWCREADHRDCADPGAHCQVGGRATRPTWGSTPPGGGRARFRPCSPPRPLRRIRRRT